MDPRLQRRLLTEWTGVDPFLSELKPSRDMREVVLRALRSLGLAERLQESTLGEIWEEMVGPVLAAHCRPGGVRRGALQVRVDHATWMHQIALIHKAHILQAVQQRMPHLKIKEINLRIG